MPTTATESKLNFSKTTQLLNEASQVTSRARELARFGNEVDFLTVLDQCSRLIQEKRVVRQEADLMRKNFNESQDDLYRNRRRINELNAELANTKQQLVEWQKRCESVESQYEALRHLFALASDQLKSFSEKVPKKDSSRRSSAVPTAEARIEADDGIPPPRVPSEVEVPSILRGIRGESKKEKAKPLPIIQADTPPPPGQESANSRSLLSTESALPAREHSATTFSELTRKSISTASIIKGKKPSKKFEKKRSKKKGSQKSVVEKPSLVSIDDTSMGKALKIG